MKFTADDKIDINGTSLQGHVTVAYADLVTKFGPPTSNGDGYKVDAEWCLKFEDGTVATIYNYKDGKNYLGAEGDAVEAITDWHIGGRHAFAASHVKAALGQ